MSKLFESSIINSMELMNRFVRSATWEGMATEDGAVTPNLVDTMSALAKGGVGLIISSHAYVQSVGKISPWQLGIYKDGFVHGLRLMAEAVHECDGKIVAQLAHAGNFATERLTGQTPVVVSDFEGLADSPRKELTKQDIEGVIGAFANAAGRAKSAGFDGVQLHSAHGYLLGQFLSPAFNRREDEYGGGGIPNRARIHLEVYKAIRKVVGKDYPILIKMNCQDFVKNGLSLEDSVQVAKLLENVGFDAIELSGGLATSVELPPVRLRINSKDKEAYFKNEACAFKKELYIPMILVGGIRSFEIAEQLVEDGTADYISMSRPFINEPDLINRWKSGDRRKSECKSDNLCGLGPASNGEGLYCVDKMLRTKAA